VRRAVSRWRCWSCSRS